MRKPKKKGGTNVIEDRTQTTIYISDELRQRLRVRAIEERTSASRIIARLVEDYLGAPKRKAGSR
jgi:hypothetical protein